jgi:hypothetical protein
VADFDALTETAEHDLVIADDVAATNGRKADGRRRRSPVTPSRP